MIHPTRQIDRYLDEGLPREAELRLLAHLRACESCRAHYDETVRLLEALAGVPDAPIPRELDRLTRRVLAAADESEQPAGAAERVVGLRAPRRTMLLSAASAAVALLVIAGGLLLAHQTSIPPVVGVLSAATGTTLDGREVGPDTQVRVGEMVDTGPKGLAVLSLSRPATLRVFPGSRLAVGGAAEEVRLYQGAVWCRVDKGEGTFTVRTNRGDARVLGTSFVVEQMKDGDVEVRVIEGTVRVRDRARLGEVDVHAGEKTRLRKEAAPSAPAPYDPKADVNAWAKFWAALVKALKGAVHAVKQVLGVPH